MIKTLLFLLVLQQVPMEHFELFDGVSTSLRVEVSHQTNEAIVFDAKDDDHQARARFIVTSKPFFKSAVPGSEELFLTFFEDFATKAKLDWAKSGLTPGAMSSYNPVRLTQFAGTLAATCDRFYLKEAGSLSLCVTIIDHKALFVLYEEAISLERPKEEVFEHMGTLLSFKKPPVKE